MPNENVPNSSTPVEAASETTKSFGELLAQFEHSHSHKVEGGARQFEGVVVSVDAESVYLDIGFKAEGILPRSAFENKADDLKSGDKIPVSVKSRNLEGYYELSRFRVTLPTDWTSLEEAFASQSAVVGIVTATVRGGLSVDVGVRAFMPASRSGVRDSAEMEKLVGQEITCRITKLDVMDEDVVVDRRVILEEQARSLQQDRYTELKEGDVVSGQVRSLASYGAFVDIGGIDGLLHVSDISWSRVTSPEDVLSVGQQLQLKILKVDQENSRISLGLKQLQPEPWVAVAEKYKVGQRITGTVAGLMDFGAFVELEPGVEGLIHVSEMSWVKKIRKPSDILKAGDTVDVIVLSVSAGERRISLGLKQALGDPWADVMQRFPTGSTIEGPVTKLMKFGAFVLISEGVEGLVHVSEISAEKHIDHPQDVLRPGQIVKAQVLAVDTEKRQINLSIKQLVSTGLGEYLAEHKEGEVVSGRVVEQGPDSVVVELGDGIRATCKLAASIADSPANPSSSGADLSALTSMLQARWKGGSSSSAKQSEPLGKGQIRSFRLVKLDSATEKIELELA
jgi:small subunit ribosomal protein S1